MTIVSAAADDHARNRAVRHALSRQQGAAWMIDKTVTGWVQLASDVVVLA